MFRRRKKTRRSLGNDHARDLSDRIAQDPELNRHTVPVGAAERPAPDEDPFYDDVPSARPRRLSPDAFEFDQLDVALTWVAVDEPQLPHEFDHTLWIEEVTGHVVGDSVFATVEGSIAGHDFVERALHEDRELLHVRAPELHPEDVRLIVATTLAPSIPPNWEEMFED